MGRSPARGPGKRLGLSLIHIFNGSNVMPSFTVGNGSVFKTQFVARSGNDYYFRVYATGKPGESTGVYTTLPGQNPVRHCVVTIG